jgi:hypothetical protein
MVSQKTIGQAYNFINGNEDARVCKDIPDAACVDQPRNFFAYVCMRWNQGWIVMPVTNPYLSLQLEDRRVTFKSYLGNTEIKYR